MEFGLSNKIVKEIKNISSKYKNTFYIFGSRARGDYNKSSDIDIAVLGEISKIDKFNILNEFDMLEMPYMIDVVFVQELSNKKLIENIINQGVEI